jgi:hypothetical protein
MLYSFKGAYPTQLPNKITLSNGKTRTDNTTFTDEEIADAGWIVVSNPPTFSYPNKLDWDGTDWVVRSPNSSETAIKIQQVRDWCGRELTRTDYKIIKSVETGYVIDDAYHIFREEVRTLYDQAMQLNFDPWNVSFPKLLIDDENEVNMAIKQVIADRYQKEISGTEWVDTNNGYTLLLDTDRDSQNKYSAILSAIQSGLRTTDETWKCRKVSGNVTEVLYRNTTNAELIEWSGYVLSHVQRCFDAEANAITKIEAGDLTATFETEFALL